MRNHELLSFLETLYFDQLSIVELFGGGFRYDLEGLIPYFMLSDW